ncbi:MAG: HD domain-containing protein [Smithellaceae bacterium]|nr:HD domain-containing protein [Smithellaceae bacterium]
MIKEKQFGSDGGASTGSAQTLRKRAESEKALQEKAAGRAENVAALSSDEVRQMLHELRVHQIELEMQNEELCRTQKKLEASRAQYFDLYDLAPVGYFTVSEQGLILQANLTAATLLGVARGALVNHLLTRFILKEDQAIYYGQRKLLLETGAPQVCELRLVKKDAATCWVRIDTTTAQDIDGAPICRATIIDITERKQAEEQLRESLEQVRRAMQTTIQVLVMAVEIKDPYTAGHQRRMTGLARTMATEMGLPPEKIEGLRMAGIIHDIGKITMPTEILSKPTKLSSIELSLIREHVQLGYNILKDVESPWPLAEIVLQHYERLDGSGYPRALKGEDILIEARILAVADVVEAMASHRPYRPALGLDAALAEITKKKGTLYDPAAVEVCLSLFREKGYQIEGA